MNNQSVKTKLSQCWNELNQLCNVHSTNPLCQYLNAYAVVKVSGTIEFAYKNIIADYCKRNSCLKTMKYIDKTIRENSSNPSLDNIYRTLKNFDEDWNKKLKEYINNNKNKHEIETAFKSIVDMRNSFAHGNACSGTLADIFKYYKWMYIVTYKMDKIVV